MLRLEDRIWKIEYSVIICFIAWVKNVYTQRTNSSVIGDILSPTHPNTITTHPLSGGQLPVTHHQVHFFTTYLSTLKTTLLSLLFASYPYYPHPLLLEPLKKI